ncbi:unnamed protein product [Gongylonema pulchrum]|uniref:Ovule protein n=1 Tax=Gongylonema pulchrum TaxID=637853 RepID=A0A183D8B7_9BILA|nr:unnamed protein product [Gongylonema pulchrum]
MDEDVATLQLDATVGRFGKKKIVYGVTRNDAWNYIKAPPYLREIRVSETAFLKVFFLQISAIVNLFTKTSMPVICESLDGIQECRGLRMKRVKKSKEYSPIHHPIN